MLQSCTPPAQRNQMGPLIVTASGTSSLQIGLLSLIDQQSEGSRELTALLQSSFRYALSLTHDNAEAEDLLQDACVAMVRSGAKWNKAYLFATIRNRFIDRYRRNKRILFVPLEGSSEAEQAEETGSEETWEVPDVIEAETLHRAFGQLRPEERELLFLTFVEGYTAQQIASMTSRPRGTVLSLIHRSKAKLRRLIGIDRQVKRND